MVVTPDLRCNASVSDSSTPLMATGPGPTKARMPVSRQRRTWTPQDSGPTVMNDDRAGKLDDVRTPNLGL